jgi:hypothetical protein
MSEAGKPVDAGKQASDDAAKSKESDFIAKSEVAKIEADRNEARAERDRLKEEKRALDARLAEIERSTNEKKAVDEGNIEALRTSFAERETALKAEKDATLKQLESAILKADVFSVLGEVCTDPEVAFLLLKDDFEVKEVDGELRARPKKDAASAKDYILKRLEAKPYLLKNNRAAGTGTEKTGANGKAGEATEIPSDFGNWEVGRKKDWMRANPKLAGLAALKAMGG